MSAWSTLYSHTGFLFVEVMALLLYISPPLNETFKHVRFPICAHGDDCRFTVFLALFTLHQQAEWHQRFREVFQHNSAVTCCKCWMSPSSFLCIVHILIHNVIYCICADCPLPRCMKKKKKTFKIGHLINCTNVLSTCSRRPELLLLYRQLPLHPAVAQSAKSVFSFSALQEEKTLLIFL